jgi:dephospho-CoA kinase
MFAAHGVQVISADEVGRKLMQPGEAVYRQIVDYFGEQVLQADGTLNRCLLADLAFHQGKLDELNRIVHPPVISAQEAWLDEIFADNPDAIAMIESALIFEASRSHREAGAVGSVPGWRDRFDRVILVTAPDEVKIERFLHRLSDGAETKTATRQLLEEDARARLATQMPDSKKIPLSDYVIDNSGPITETQQQVDTIFADLQRSALSR